MKANQPDNERERLEWLRALDILDTMPEEAYDRITRIASEIAGTPIALVSLIDEDRQWFKSRVGLDAPETPRDVAFCAHAILDDEVMVVPDARRDPRFRDSPLVTGAPDIRFYAGAPLAFDGDVRLGTLCVIDTEPRELGPDTIRALRDLAAVVVDELRLRRKVRELAEARRKLDCQAWALELANQALEQFAHMASHDLRSPLKSMVNLADIALLEGGDARESLELIRSAGSELEALVAGYRRLSRLERTESASRLVSELVEAARSRSAGTMTAVTRGDAPVAGDPVLLTQVFTNLIENAGRYGVDRHVEFDARSADGWTTVCARNRVARDVAVDASVFSPFRRLTNEGEGTGLGLAIVDRVARLHGGSAAASCENQTFTVELTLPCTPVAA